MWTSERARCFIEETLETTLGLWAKSLQNTKGPKYQISLGTICALQGLALGVIVCHENV